MHQKVKTTTIYVTHDQVEAMTLADRVVVMNGGRIEQIGRPQDLYHRPKSRFVAGFIGSPAMNFLPARLQSNGDGLLLRLAPELAFPVPPTHTARYQSSAGKDLILGLRPEHITEPRGEGREPRCEFAMTLDVIEPMGMETMVFFTVNGTEVCARVEPSAASAPGQPMRLYANPARCSPPTSSICLRAIAAKIQELLRSPDQPPLAQLPFFVGCRNVAQAVDFLTCHFRRFRGFLGTHSCPLGDPKRELHKPADGFGARRIVLLRRRPAIDARKRCGLETQADRRALARGRRRPLLLP